MDIKNLKVLGIVTTVVGAIASVAGSLIADKKQDAELNDKVAKAVSEAFNNKN